MYFCEWCKTRTQQTVEFPREECCPRDKDNCTECGWEKELLCPTCEGGVTELDFSVYNRTEDTEQSRGMFDGWLSTNQLAGILGNQMDSRDEFWGDYEASLWNRGSICRALADKGVTQKLINFMKS